MKASRYAVLALATATVFGLAMSTAMAQNTSPTQSSQDTSKDAMKSDAMKSNSDAMKSNSDAMGNDATKGAAHHKGKHGSKKTEPAAASSSGH